MINIKKSEDRGQTKIDWLDSKHSFSFGDYYDPENISFHSLRVINEDIVAPGQGFGTHPHKNMEIITFVLEGALEHKDNLGTGSIIRPGTIQRMTAGRGITHSEFNHSKTDPVHLLQIWLTPEKIGLPPSYEEANFKFENNYALLAAPEGMGGAVKINQDAKIYALGNIKEEIKFETNLNRAYWLQVAKGSALVNDIELNQGYALAIENEKVLKIICKNTKTEIILFDLAKLA